MDSNPAVLQAPLVYEFSSAKKTPEDVRDAPVPARTWDHDQGQRFGNQLSIMANGTW